MKHSEVLKAAWDFMDTVISEIEMRERDGEQAGFLFDNVSFYTSPEILKAIDKLSKDLNVE